MRWLVFVVAAVGCSSSSNMQSSADMSVSDSSTSDLSSAGGRDLLVGADLANLVTSDGGLVAARPYHFYVPSGYDSNTPTPLVIMLHGYSASGDIEESYWKLTPTAEKHTFLYAYPDGTIDGIGNRFWNATDACCNFAPPFIDDVAYLNAIIDDVSARYNVDAKRIFVTGHSNGGFMSHRMACDAPRVAAIASLAGAVWKDPSKCVPAAPVSVLEIHGDADTVIAYNGGANEGHQYPSAHDTVATWAEKDGCTGALTDTGTTLDLDSSLIGSETRVERYAGCPSGISVELWTIQGGSHIPAVTSIWGDTLYGFLASHPKP